MVHLSLSERVLCGEPGGMVPLLGTPKDMLNKGLKMGVCFHSGPAFGKLGGMLLF